MSFSIWREKTINEITGAYLEPCQTSNIDFFAKIVKESS